MGGVGDVKMRICLKNGLIKVMIPVLTNLVVLFTGVRYLVG